jgi:membrane-associated HD superfamily phosphohydrolase
MKPKSASAEAGFVLSIIAFLLVLIGMAVSNALVFGFFGLATSIAALVCSIVGAVSCRATGVRRGMALAVTGVIISAIMLFLGFAETIMWLQQM